jgi:outer membrane protein assembly factor BamB
MVNLATVTALVGRDPSRGEIFVMRSTEITLKMISRLRSRAAVVGAALSFVLVAPSYAAAPFPTTIALPDGFQPEGIATTAANTFFVGSIPTGTIVRGDLRTGETSVLVSPPASASRSAIGMKEHNGVLFVAGGATGQAYAYDANTGAELRLFQLDAAPTFVNDVVVTRDAVFFTDSLRPQIYRVPIGTLGELGEPKKIPLTGAIVYQAGFNANGIDATADGNTLIIVQGNTGFLFTVDPETGVTQQIDLGGETVINGDGILLDGNRLWVVQNRLNLLTAIQLLPDVGSGMVEGRFTDETLDVPTTMARAGDRIILVNARFGNPSPTTAQYWLTQIPRPR